MGIMPMGGMFFTGRRPVPPKPVPQPRSGEAEHPVQSHSRPLGSGRRHLDAVDHPVLHEVVQYPGQVARVNAIHRAAQANHFIEAEYLLVRMLRSQAMNQIYLGPDGDN